MAAEVSCVTTETIRRRERRSDAISGGLFEGTNGKRRALADAEAILIDLANYVYAHSTLKPISKTLFLISRCLLLCSRRDLDANVSAIKSAYRSAMDELGPAGPDDDFQFESVIDECAAHLPYIVSAINRVRALTVGSDSLGLAFDTLLRGKFEGGEGLGTFLTPEEVVYPMVEMALSVLDRSMVIRLSEDLVYGDICAGTGRFVYALAKSFATLGVDGGSAARAARLFDQSRMAVDFGRLNFLFDGLQPHFRQVDDSMISPAVGELTGRFAVLATNPPFGAGKYRWRPELPAVVRPELLRDMGVFAPDGVADPSELFLFRNLDLLASGGVLAIVLPDGVLYSDAFVRRLSLYEELAKACIEVAGVVSLPVATFALGGTVAKTSFAIIRKDEHSRGITLFAETAEHVGFVKKGNRRASDLAGNDLERIAERFAVSMAAPERGGKTWREYSSLAPSRIAWAKSLGDAKEGWTTLRDLVVAVRRPSSQAGSPGAFHVSVLDIDETGLLDIVAASRNRPVTAGIECRPNDVLISCLNPRIWRVAVVPELLRPWSCSAEFIVLRPKKDQDSWKIAVALHHKSVIEAIKSFAHGTSSSRQRVPKEQILAVSVPLGMITFDSLSEHVETRREWYVQRLRESEAYEAVHSGAFHFGM